MLFCTDDYPGDDLKTEALAFLISEWRAPIKLEMSDFSWTLLLTAKQLSVVYGEQESYLLCRYAIRIFMSSDKASPPLAI